MLKPLATVGSINGDPRSSSAELAVFAHRWVHTLTLGMDAWFLDRSRHLLRQHGFDLGRLCSAAINCAAREIFDMV